MSDKRLMEAYHQCLADLELGSELETVLAKYPDLAAELRPLLLTSQDMYALTHPEVPKEIQNRSQARLFAQAAKLQEQKQKPRNIFPLRLRWAFIVLMVLVLSFSWNEIAVVSAHALPGDPMYTIKRAIEELKLGFAFDTEKHHAIEEQFEERRVEEIHQLLAEKRSEMVEYYDTVEKMGEDTWIIGGVNVNILPGTEIIGEITAGMIVEVEGYTDESGFVQAVEIHLERFELTGVIEELSSKVWIVSGKQINVSRDTVIQPDIALGDQVKILVSTDDAGNLSAERIQALSQVSFSGRVQALLEDSILVTGRIVTVDENTMWDDGIIVNDQVEILAVQINAGNLLARQVNFLYRELPEVEDDGDDDVESEGDDEYDQSPENSEGFDENQEQEDDSDTTEIESDSHNENENSESEEKEDASENEDEDEVEQEQKEIESEKDDEKESSDSDEEDDQDEESSEDDEL